MADAVAAVREFNRFYTRRIGALGPGFLATEHTLAEARVLYELAQRETVAVAELRAALGMDAGHLSRLLARLERKRLVARRRSPEDGRRQLAELTEAGRAAAAALDRRSADEVGAQLAPLDDARRGRLVHSLAELRRLLDPGAPAPLVVVRAPRPGDLGWLIMRNAQLYAEEYGWDASYETLVARIVADFAAQHDAAREAAWIAELDGAPAGCVLCVRRDERTAQLRLLLVEPWARGAGIGTRLVDECLRFARAAGYEEIMLWTNDPLTSARRIYERAGFALVAEEPHRSFGHDLVGQTWSRSLR